MKENHKKPTILFIAHTNNLKGGGELSVVELIKSTINKGYGVHVVVPSLGEFADKLDELKVSHTEVKYTYWGKPYDPKESSTNIQAISNIASVITTFKVNCVVTNTLMIPWGALAAALTNVPHIWITREKLDMHRAHLFETYDFIEAFSNIVFANSKDNSEYLKTHVGLKNVRQFYSFVDENKLKLGGEHKEPRIINIAAHIRPSKDQFELVKALAVLRKRNKLHAKTIFIGNYSDDKEYFNEIEKFIKENNLADKVTFSGFHENPFKLVGPNDIFVRTSKYESLGRTITEAMKLGLICVAADISSTKEAFGLGGGTEYKAGSYNDLADKLEYILNNHEASLHLAKLSKQRALKSLSEENCHKPFFEALDKIISSANPQKELRHFRSQFAGLAEILSSLEKDLFLYRNLSMNLQRELDAIYSSRSWKLSQKVQKAANVARGTKNRFTKEEKGL